MILPSVQMLFSSGDIKKWGAAAVLNVLICVSLTQALYLSEVERRERSRTREAVINGQSIVPCTATSCG